jgi:acetoin utilization deacetylase AcuC-like enzyme
MTMELRKVAEECCGGRIAAVTEGGYDLRELAESLRAVIDVLAGAGETVGRWPIAAAPSSSRGRAAVDAANATLGSFWKLDSR